MANPKNEHGYCKHCGLDFDGGDIVQEFIKLGQTPEQARETASHYGYGPGRTQWDRRIGVEEYGDRINYRICPECKGRQ